MELNIIHVDMDAFYAAVEQRDNPKLKGKPVIIGGKSKRGVVSTASYEAREYGVHSAMPVVKARQLCPDGVYLKPNHDKYKQVSKKIRAIFKQYTDLVEPLSLDEAYLDVSEAGENSIQAARQIKRKIQQNLDLTASVGISYNKYLAKLASDLDKPDGFEIISPFEAKELIFPLDVSELWGVGPKTEEELKELGLETIKDVAQADKKFLIRKLGKRGYQLHKLARGEDPREVTPPGEPKSIGTETTFSSDIGDKDKLKEYLVEVSEKVANRVENNQLQGQTVTLKLKYADFEVISRSKTVDDLLQHREEIYQLAEKLLEEVKLEKEVRLIGVTLSNFANSRFEQLKLFKV
jgi:DNA polymerase-4